MKVYHITSDDLTELSDCIRAISFCNTEGNNPENSKKYRREQIEKIDTLIDSIDEIINATFQE